MKRFFGMCTFCLMLCASCVQTPDEPSRRPMEKLDRGVVAVRENAEQVAVSWRYLSSDPMKTSFNVYRNEELIAEVPAATGTFYKDSYVGTDAVKYTVHPVVRGKEKKEEGGTFVLPANAPEGYLEIPLQLPEGGVTPAGEPYAYTANDASVGDVDGDGQYEIFLKWDPTNSKDNAYDGYAGNVYVDCYRLTGELLWRIDLGKNIRAGAHYTQFIVFDLDGDGKCELVMKTSDGTVDGEGTVIGDALADYRDPGDPTKPSGGDFPKGDPRGMPREGDPPYNQGRVLVGNEYLTVFEGESGKALATVDYIPPRGDLNSWGDPRANRGDRFLAAVAYLDGVHPSVVMCRGYYTRSVLAAFDWDGKNLTNRWTFDSDNPGCHEYAGQGNHNLRVGDVDGDGCDEIVYGQCTIDHDGNGLYSTRMGHGDAMHLTSFAADMEGLQVFSCHENRRDGTTFRDARTGEVIWQVKSGDDVGRCMAADIDAENPGLELWSLRTGGLRTVKGDVLQENVKGLSCNMAVWWDGDLLREIYSHDLISKYDRTKRECVPLKRLEGTTWNNGTKGNPCLQADILGDWREEVLVRTVDNKALRLYVTPIETEYRFHTFLEDPVYRLSVAMQNIAYNQPTQPGFYFGPDLKGRFRGFNLK